MNTRLDCTAPTQTVGPPSRDHLIAKDALEDMWRAARRRRGADVVCRVMHTCSQQCHLFGRRPLGSQRHVTVAQLGLLRLCSATRGRQTGRHREKGRGKESARACVRACVQLSEHLVSVPTVTLSAHKGVGGEREFIGPLLSADGCA